MPYLVLFAFDLSDPDTKYISIMNSIRSLGPSYPLEKNIVFSSSSLEPASAYAEVAKLLTPADRLTVVEIGNAIISNAQGPNIVDFDGVWRTRR